MTEPERIEATLRWVREDLADSAILTGVLSPQGKWLGANPTLTNALGRELDDLTGCVLEQTLDPSCWVDGAARLTALSAGDALPNEDTLTFRTPEGQQLELALSWVAITDGAGRVACLLVQGRDLAPELARERLLTRTRDHHSLVVEANRIGVFEVNLATGIIKCDSQAESALGYGPGELDGVALTELRDRHPFEELTDHEQSIRDAYSRGRDGEWHGPILLITRRTRSRAGDPVWLRIGIRRQPIRRHDRALVVLGSIQDVSPEILRQVELEKTQQALRDSQWLLQAASEGSEVGHWTMNLDTGEYWLDPSNSALLGYAPGEHPRNLDEVLQRIHPEDLPRVKEAMAEARLSERNLARADYRFRRLDGSYVWIGASARGRFNSAGEFVLYGGQQDISARVEAKDRLRVAANEAEAAHSRLQLLAERVPGGLFEMRLNAVSGRYQMAYVSPGYAEVFGLTVHELMTNDRASFQKIHPDDLPSVLKALPKDAPDRTLHHTTFRICDDDGSVRWVSAGARLHKFADGTLAWFGSVYDVTAEVSRSEALKLAQQRAEYLSLHDGLTGLPNRRYFDSELAKRMPHNQRNLRNNEALTLVRIDLDHFKHVNDTLGHDAGDAVLIHVAETLNQFRRQDDFVARLGGDEFAIIMAPGSDVVGQFGALSLATRLRETLSKPMPFQGRMARFGASFGIASSLTQPDRHDKLLSFADAALYEAKAAGRGQVKLFTPELRAFMEKTQRVAHEIEEALERGEFVPYFHPQVNAQTGALAGFEVLARWKHPSRGLLPPEEFLDVAEQIKRVQDIDKAIFERAMKIGAAVMSEGLALPKLSFNISWGRLNDPEFIASLGDRIAPELPITFELLESILLEDMTPVMQYHLDQLREAGIGIEMDDFGSGRASVVGMMQVAPEAIKLDQRLVRPIIENEKAIRLVSALIDIAQGMDIAVIAEGVETLKHASILRMLECNCLQGFAFGPPITEVAMRDYIRGYAPLVLDVA